MNTGSRPTIVDDNMLPTQWEYYGREEHDHDMSDIVNSPKQDYKILAKFNGSWENDLEIAISLAKKVRYVDRGEHSNYLYDAQVTDALPQINQMASLLGFEKCMSNQIQMQRPGCLMSRHMDTYRDPYVRVLITLSHWEWGQYIFINNNIIQHWQPGEVIYAEYNKMMHCTCNCSSHTRPILQITGIPGQRLKDLIQSTETINISI